MRPSRWHIALLPIAFLLLTVLLALCLRGRVYPTTDDDIRAYFARHGQQAGIRYDSVLGRPIHWIDLNTTGSDSAPVVIFVHGGAGNANHWLHFMSDTALNRHARMLAFDRLGYAPFDLGQPEPGIQRQAEAIGRILSRYRYPWAVVVAHSYGGPIAMAHVLSNPGKVRAALLLAPALDPDLEKNFRSVVLTQWRWTRWAIPRTLRMAAEEYLAHREELERMMPLWDNMRADPVPVVHLHGTWDFIIPYDNTAMAKAHVPEDYLRTVTIHRGDHFLPWTSRKLIRDELLWLLTDPEGRFQ